MTESGSQSSGRTKKGTSTTAAKKTTAKKTAAKKTATSSDDSSRKRSPREETPKAMSGSRVAAEAVRQFGELSSKEVEGVTSLRRTDDGWVVELDVLELRRIPETTDVLGLYEVTLDASGELEGYRRAHRYVRGQTED
jgi:uncharacterized heparinase superfamily protein